MAMDPKQEKIMAMLCHLLPLLPGVYLIPTLVIWLMKKEESAMINDHGKAALNFQISIFVYAVIAWLLIFVLVGGLLLPAVGIFFLVNAIIAGVKANDGELYKYPLTIQFIK